MILTCPTCGTQYVVKDGAIPPEGRQVRCASCKHSWHQDPEHTAEVEPQRVEAVAADEQAVAEDADAAPHEPVEDESVAEATLIEPRSGPELEERAYEEATFESDQGEDSATAAEDPASSPYAHSEFDIVTPPAAKPAFVEDGNEPPQSEAQDDEFSPFPAQDEVAPKRRSPALAVLAIVVAILIIAAAIWFLAPADLKARLGVGGAGLSPLALVTTHMERQQLESGNELLTVTGRVINPTGKEQQVPPLQAQLKTKAGKIVYSWTIAPPARSLPAGASASFNSAEVNVPPGGDELTITIGAQGA